MSKTITELRAEAKELGINTFQMGAAEIEAAITAATGGETPVTEGLDVKARAKERTARWEPKEHDKALGDGWTEVEEPAPKQPTDAEYMAAFAAQMAKEAKEAIAKLQQAQITTGGKRKSTPEEEIIKRHTSDKAKIAAQEKARITIPGGLMGMPERYTSVVNGHMCEVFPGEPKDVPLAHYENLMLSFDQAKKNALKSAKMERMAKGLATK